jgi:hypothetical protein|tara:strand:- start:891 stop:1139 length:249 start_codon:yes stop_codon:yes gene_type:complete
MKTLIQEQKDSFLQQKATLEAQIAEQQSRKNEADAEQQRLYPVLFRCQGAIQACEWLLANGPESVMSGLPEAEEADIVEVTV